MKVLLLNGSPHKHGTTFAALSEVASTLEAQGIETEIYHIGSGPVYGCVGCGQCFKAGKCVYHQEDIVNEIIEKAKEADGFIFGAPVHYARPAGIMNTVLDRVFYAGGRNFAYKPGAAVVCCRRGGATAAFDALNKYFTISCMPVVPSQYWNMVHGHNGEEAKQDAEGMQTMRTLGNNMAWMLRCIEAGRAAGIDHPEREPVQRTNFIR